MIIFNDNNVETLITYSIDIQYSADWFGQSRAQADALTQHIGGGERCVRARAAHRPQPDAPRQMHNHTNTNSHKFFSQRFHVFH